MVRSWCDAWLPKASDRVKSITALLLLLLLLMLMLVLVSSLLLLLLLLLLLSSANQQGSSTSLMLRFVNVMGFSGSAGASVCCLASRSPAIIVPSDPDNSSPVAVSAPEARAEAFELRCG